jgi:hypothetical protein
VGHKEAHHNSGIVCRDNKTESLRALRNISLIISGFFIFFTFVQIILSYVPAFTHPLRRAIEWGDIKAVEKLMAKDYDSNCRIWSKTPLTYTILNCLHTPWGFIRHKDEEDLRQKVDAKVEMMIDILEVLVSNGADINKLDDDGEAILHYAISDFIYIEARPKVVKWLLDRGADPNLKNSRGETPLHLVSWSYHIRVNEVAKLLLEYGAEMNATNAKGYTPLQLAIDNNNQQIAKLLREQGAKE